MLAHPFAPFITETVWQTLDWEQDSLLADRPLNKTLPFDEAVAAKFSEVQAIVTEVRYITKALGVSGVSLYYTGTPFLSDNAGIIKQLARLQAVSEVQAGTGIHLTNTKYRAWLDIDKSVAQAYVKKLVSRRAAQEASIKQLAGRLDNKSYVKNAPKEVVAETKAQLAAAKTLLDSLKTEEERFGQNGDTKRD